MGRGLESWLRREKEGGELAVCFLFVLSVLRGENMGGKELREAA